MDEYFPSRQAGIFLGWAQWADNVSPINTIASRDQFKPIIGKKISAELQRVVVDA